MEGFGKVDVLETDPFSAVGSVALVPNSWWDKQLKGSSRCRVAGYIPQLAPPPPPRPP